MKRENMTSRERVRLAINHKEADRVPLDLGSTLVTGIQASVYHKLKNVLSVSKRLVKVYDPFQMLAEVEDEIKQLLGVDTYGIQLPVTIFGYRNENWKTFKMFDGTEVLISANLEYDVLENGDIVQYPKGDRDAPPSGKMPKGGYYFDIIVRQEPIDESRLESLNELKAAAKGWWHDKSQQIVYIKLNPATLPRKITLREG